MIVLIFFIYWLGSLKCKDVAVLDAYATTAFTKKIFKDYDKKALPKINGEPVNVTVQMYIEDMVPVDLMSSHYSIDMYFRTYWRDPRLSFEDLIDVQQTNGSNTLAFSHTFIEQIWTPDLFFPLAKLGHVHVITKPNRLLRLKPDGSIFYSQRLSVTNYCPMNLLHFPFDEQYCQFTMLSFGYDASHIMIGWNTDTNGPIYPPVDRNMLEYMFAGFNYSKLVHDYTVAGKIETLVATFHFTRHSAYYLAQMYFPCVLIVILSWVGFWIDYRSTPARVTLGITTVLTMTSLSGIIKSSSPDTTQVKSLDIYVLVCLFYVFAALIQYALLWSTDIKIRKIMKKKGTASERSEIAESRKESAVSTSSCASASVSEMPLSARSYRIGLVNPAFSAIHKEDLERTYETTIKMNNSNAFNRMTVKISGKVKQKMFEKQMKDLEVHVIDRISRYLFPITFGILNISYFGFYLSR